MGKKWKGVTGREVDVIETGAFGGATLKMTVLPVATRQNHLGHLEQEQPTIPGPHRSG